MEWKLQYAALKEYIANHPEIVINPTEISIPKALRDEFYRLFDELRRAVVDAYSSSLILDLELLRENYVRIEKEVTDLLKVEGIAMPMDLYSFVHHPKEGLMRILYNRTFDLLQGKTTIEDYESQSGAELESVAEELYRLGYEQWAALVVIKLLDPDEAYFVDLDEDYKPYLTELKTIAFGRQAHHPTMRIPEFVLHSRKLDKYVAVKMLLSREIETYVAPFKPAVRPRKKTGDTSSALDTRALLLSIMRTREDIPVIADIYELKRTSPDWIMESITAGELEDAAVLDQVSRNLRALNPTRGRCLVVVGAGADARLENIPDDICAVSAGFDQSRFAPVVDSLAV